MNSSSLIDSFTAQGARVRSEPAPPVVLTFGDVPAEYKAAQEACALFDATDRARVDVSGPDAATFLQRLLAGDVRKLEVGRAQRNLLLSSKGKVLFDFDIVREEQRLRLSLRNGLAKPLLAALDMYLFSEKVKLEDSTATHAPLELVGPHAAAVIAAATGVAPPAELGACTRGAFQGIELAQSSLVVAGSPGFRIDAGPEQAPALWKALCEHGASPAGRVVRDILRVEAGAAEHGIDIDENVYPQEARLESAFSLDKGCYIGQEVVAKIDTYGGLNKRLTLLRATHDDPIARGTRLYRLDEGEWRDLGVVTSWSYSFVHDTGAVLAYVKRRHQALGTEFRIGEGPATATIVAMPARAGAVPVTGEFQ